MASVNVDKNEIFETTVNNKAVLERLFLWSLSYQQTWFAFCAYSCFNMSCLLWFIKMIRFVRFQESCEFSYVTVSIYQYCDRSYFQNYMHGLFTGSEWSQSAQKDHSLNLQRMGSRYTWKHQAYDGEARSEKSSWKPCHSGPNLLFPSVSKMGKIK